MTHVQRERGIGRRHPVSRSRATVRGRQLGEPPAASGRAVPSTHRATLRVGARYAPSNRPGRLDRRYTASVVAPRSRSARCRARRQQRIQTNPSLPGPIARAVSVTRSVPVDGERITNNNRNHLCLQDGKSMAASLVPTHEVACRSGARHYPSSTRPRSCTVLGLAGGIDYAQLRRGFRLVREPDDEPSRKWARSRSRISWRFRGGSPRRRRGRAKRERRLQLGELERACRSLRALGIRGLCPGAAPFAKDQIIVVELDGMTFDRPRTSSSLSDTSDRVRISTLAKVVELPLHARVVFIETTSRTHGRLSRSGQRHSPDSCQWWTRTGSGLSRARRTTA